YLWSKDSYYDWYAWNGENHTFSSCKGFYGFNALCWDTGFQSVNTYSSALCYTSFSNTGYSTANQAKYQNINVGDIITWDRTPPGEKGWDYVGGIVLDITDDYYIIAEAIDGEVHWNTKLPRTVVIESLKSRWAWMKKNPPPYYWTVTINPGVTYIGEENNPVKGMPETRSIKLDQAGDLTYKLPKAPTREGYFFDYWNVDGKKHYPGEILNIYQNTWITAQWAEIKKLPIVNYLTGEADFDDLTDFPYGQMITYKTFHISEMIPKWEGHTFSGWAAEGYTEPLYQPGVTLYGVYKNTNLVAVWDKPVPEGSEEERAIPEVREVGQRILALKETYPEGSEFPEDFSYTWYAWDGNTQKAVERVGNNAFVSMCWDAGFESDNTESGALCYTNYPTEWDVEYRSPNIGNIVTYNIKLEDGKNKRVAAIITAINDDSFFVATAYDGIVHWNVEVPKTERLYSMLDRWDYIRDHPQ
nr:InlB B-repeat-containing protein [Lachnospiraceae bacterium]